MPTTHERSGTPVERALHLRRVCKNSASLPVDRAFRSTTLGVDEAWEVGTPMVISRRHDWLRALEALSTTIASMQLTSSLADADYAETSRAPNLHALNFASEPSHNKTIARCIEGLAFQGVPTATLAKWVTDLTGPTTYGAYCELSTYAWLFDRHVPFEPQAARTGAQVLNSNGADIDGIIKSGGTNLLFDVKGFAFVEGLINRVVQRLRPAFPGKFIGAQGAWTASTDDMTELLGPGFGALKQELQANAHAHRHGLDFDVRPPAPVQMTVHTQGPYELAMNNADYAFSYAKQFARTEPFLLIFVAHPWFSGVTMTSDSMGERSAFMRAFARRTFLQFRNDQTPLIGGATKAQAAGLLSGVGFLSLGPGSRRKQPLRMYLNPLAQNPISELTLDHMSDECRGEMYVHRFTDDVY